jgi:signal transduction histidine kinase/CheY-like chemotaxis protein/HPt (histidine-containing phosphotransfer) domain-containing protein
MLIVFAITVAALIPNIGSTARAILIIAGTVAACLVYVFFISPCRKLEALVKTLKPVAGFARDLRERRRIMKEIDYRDYLLNTANSIASILIQSETERFESDLNQCLSMLAKAVGIDRISIWENRTDVDQTYFVQLYSWSEGAGFDQSRGDLLDKAFSGQIRERLLSGSAIQSPIQNMPPEVRAILSQRKLLSVYMAPIFLQDQFWGLVGYGNCLCERVFSENEQRILRSVSLVITSALLRNEMTLKIHSDVTELSRLQEELKSALIEAKSANSAKTAFLARVSHEMRTPLNAIIGFSELTLETKGLSKESSENIENIYAAGLTLLNTVNDILDISKIEAGKLDIVTSDYDIPSLINDTVTQNILRLGEKPIKFILDINSDLPARLRGDELRVKQVLNNLLSNALKYTKEGMVALSIRCERENNMVWMTARVKDTGIGIRSEDLGNLFVDYTQFDVKSHYKIEGTGLGLTITKRILDMLGGSINVESEYGVGSVFTARFPQNYVSDETIGAEMVERLKTFNYSVNKRASNLRFVRARLPYARILIVDDNVTNLEVAKGLMKPYEMQVDCVISGKQAIDAIRFEMVRYNAVFMDHMMPEMDGIEATRIIRKEIGTEYAENVPIIALTANAIVGNEKMFLENGFQDFLSKPIDIMRLDAVIKRWARSQEYDKMIGDSMTNKQDTDWQIAPESKADARPINKVIPGLDLESGIERFSCQEIYFEVLRSFADSTPQLIDLLRNPSGSKLGDYAVHSHGIKGSSRGIGAFAVGNMAEALERAAKAGDFDYVNNNNGDFIDKVEALISDINSLLDEFSASSAKPKKDKPDKEKLEKLMAACAKYDMDKVEVVMSEIEAYEYESDDGLTKWLRENVSLTNFAQIKEKLTILTAGA